MPIAPWQSEMFDRIMTREKYYLHDPGRRRAGRGVVTMTPDKIRVKMDLGGPAYTYAISEQVLKDSEATPNCRCTMSFMGEPDKGSPGTCQKANSPEGTP